MRSALVALLLLVGACASNAKKEEAAEAEQDWKQGVEIVGNDVASTGDLMLAASRELRSFARRGKKADVADAAYSMEMRLRELGLAHAAVGFEQTGEGARFEVDEGPRVRLGEVKFHHDDPVTDEELAEFFQFAGAGLMGTGTVYFREDQILSALAEVEKHYLGLGYYEVEIEEPEFLWSEDRSVADVRVRIRAGRLYRVEAVKVTGVVVEGFESQVGRPFQSRIAAELGGRLRGELLRLGHQFCDVHYRTDVDRERAFATIRIEVEPGPIVRLNEVRFEGEDRTEESFLRSRIPLEADDIISQDRLDEGLDELYRTGLFGAVRPRLQPVEGRDDLADLEVGLRELESRSLGVEVGWGSYEMLRGGIRAEDRNLLGYGRRLILDVGASMKSWDVGATILDPWLLGRNDVVELTGGFGFREEPSFDRRTLAAELAVRHRFEGTPYRARVSYLYKDQKATNIFGVIDPVDERELTTTAGLYGVLIRDTRDNPLIPTEGSITSVGLGWSSEALGATLNFLELKFSGATHIKLPNDSVLAFGVDFISKPILDDNQTLPIQERLFMGGPSNVRSFRQDRLGPVAPTGDPAGGLTSLYAGIEWRQRVWQQFHTALFVDFGLVDPQALSFSFEPGYGVGVGFHYYLPIGPIRVDVAYNPGPLFAESRRWNVHLAIGFVF
jgi:outer membrane protein assembly complex protein YaeT